MQRSNALSLVTYLTAATLVVLIGAPLLWMVLSSLKPATELFVSPPTFLPTQWSAQWYEAVLSGSAGPRLFFNSFIVGAGTTVLCLTIGVLAAYGMTRFSFPGKALFMGTALVSYMFPAIVLFVPIYMTMAALGLTNSYFGLILCHSILTFPFAVWMLRSFFTSIPREIDEAAWIDGCSYLATFFRIILPLSLPGIFSVGIFVFVQSWNEYLFGSIMMTMAERKTVPVGISEYITSFDIRWGEIMAMGTLATLPVVLLFLAIQKYFIRGVLSGAIKG